MPAGATAPIGQHSRHEADREQEVAAFSLKRGPYEQGSFSKAGIRSICFEIAADMHRNLAPNRMSRLIAMGQAIKMLCAQFSTQAMFKPKAKKVNTPDSAVDMKPAITKDATSWGKRPDFLISHLQL